LPRARRAGRAHEAEPPAPVRPDGARARRRAARPGDPDARADVILSGAVPPAAASFGTPPEAYRRDVGLSCAGAAAPRRPRPAARRWPVELVMWSMIVLAAAIAAGGLAFAGAPGATRMHALAVCVALLVISVVMLALAAVGPRVFS